MDVLAFKPRSARSPADPATLPGDFSTVYEQEFAYVWNCVRRLGIPEKDRDDAVHDVFVVLFRHWGELDPQRPVRPWLAGTAVKVAANYRRRAHVRQELTPETMPDPRDGRPGPEQCVASQESREVVHAALARLEPRQRTVLELHELEGRSIADLSATLQVPEGTLHSRLHAARNRFSSALRRLLSGRGQP